MLKRIFAIMIICSAAILYAKQMSVDDTKGFRDANFGDDISKFPDMKLIHEDDSGLKIYTRKNDKLQIGDIPLEWITYTFFKDKMYEVRFMAKEPNKDINMIALLNVFIDKYGQYHKKEIYEHDKRLITYNWLGKKVSIEMTICGKTEDGLYVANNACQITYLPIENKRSKAFHESFEKRKKERSKKAQDDL